MAKTAKPTKAKETAKKMTSAPEKAMTKAPKAATKALMAKEISKKTVKSVAPAKALKGDKKSEKIEVMAAETPATENAEEEEDDLAETAATSGGDKSGLALAAATADTAAGSLKNFRHHPDIENFYRFIYENDLRYEALEIIDIIAAQRETVKKGGLKMAAGKAKH